MKSLVGNPEGKRPRGRLNVDGKEILKWILNKDEGRVWNELIWFRRGSGGF
jgi:hypothetical protein